MSLKKFIMLIQEDFPFRFRRQKMRSSCRRKRDHGSEFRIVGQAGSRESIGPRPVKNIFPVTVGLTESREFTIGRPEFMGNHSPVRADRATFLKGLPEFRMGEDHRLSMKEYATVGNAEF